MANLLEYVGTIHIIMGVYRGNPIALYLQRTEQGFRISPQVYPWNEIVGVGETPNRAAADLEEKWKAKGLAPEMYTGPHWEGGIKPEKPAPPKSAAAPKPTGATKPADGATATDGDPTKKAPVATTKAPEGEGG